MMLTILIISIIGLTFVQITIFKSLPKFLKGLLSYVPILGMIVNFFISGIVLMFTGVGMFAGVANLIGSIILGIYMYVYKKIYGIKIFIEWRGKWIFRVPVLVVKETLQPGNFWAGIF